MDTLCVQCPNHKQESNDVSHGHHMTTTSTVVGVKTVPVDLELMGGGWLTALKCAWPVYQYRYLGNSHTGSRATVRLLSTHLRRQFQEMWRSRPLAAAFLAMVATCATLFVLFDQEWAPDQETMLERISSSQDATQF